MPRASIEIRIAVEADAPAISQVVMRALREVNARDYEPDIIDAVAANFFPEKIADLIKSRVVLVAMAASEIVGTASLDGAKARGVFVRPDRLRRGIGAALMRKIETLASARGVEKLTVVSSITAEGFYGRQGYRVVRDRFHGRERTIIMEKELREDRWPGAT